VTAYGYGPDVHDPARLLVGSRTVSASFENPAAERGTGGQAGGGRKGAANKVLEAGERVRLAALTGPGRITHMWATFASTSGPTTPTVARAQLLEMTYTEMDAPSVSAPVPDYFGAAHGMRVAYSSALTAINEGLGYSSRVPIPFDAGVFVEWENRSADPVVLYYQVDALLGSRDTDMGFLHVAFRRENPTVQQRDFTITNGLSGPGRFLGWVGGVRVLDPEHWWGEGEVKLYIDGDAGLPTICGTGTEDYLDSAWGLGTFDAPETGAAVFASEGEPDHHHRLVSFYRWHLADPVVFGSEFRATIQQIGAAESGLFERSDDWCATAFTYCAVPQTVPRCELDDAVADLPGGRRGLRLVRRV